MDIFLLHAVQDNKEDRMDQGIHVVAERLHGHMQCHVGKACLDSFMSLILQMNVEHTTFG